MRASIQPREYPDYIPDIFVVRLEKERYQLFPNNLGSSYKCVGDTQ